MKEITQNNNRKLVEKVKGVVTELLSLLERPRENYSVYIANRLKLNYTYLANVFSETCGITIEHYIIDRKIKKAASMLRSGKYSITEITKLLSYSSIGHFSNQFKQVTGLRPTAFVKSPVPIPVQSDCIDQ